MSIRDDLHLMYSIPLGTKLELLMIRLPLSQLNCSFSLLTRDHLLNGTARQAQLMHSRLEQRRKPDMKFLPHILAADQIFLAINRLVPTTPFLIRTRIQGKSLSVIDPIVEVHHGIEECQRY